MSLRGEPATAREIKEAEEVLGVNFHKDYKDLIQEFGGVSVGVDIYAFKNHNMMSGDSVVDLTQTFRTDYEDDYRSDIINKSYVISHDDMGNPIMVNEKGGVVIFYHDSDEYELLTDNLSDFIEGLIDGKSIYDFND